MNPSLNRNNIQNTSNWTSNSKEIVLHGSTSISSYGTTRSTTSSSKNLPFMDSTILSFSTIYISNEKIMTFLKVCLFLQRIINFHLSWATPDSKMVQARFSSCPKFKRSFGNEFTRNSI